MLFSAVMKFLGSIHLRKIYLIKNGSVMFLCFYSTPVNIVLRNLAPCYGKVISFTVWRGQLDLRKHTFFQYLMQGSVADKDSRLVDVDVVTAVEL